jgi:hypothetical protein
MVTGEDPIGTDDSRSSPHAAPVRLLTVPSWRQRAARIFAVAMTRIMPAEQVPVTIEPPAGELWSAAILPVLGVRIALIGLATALVSWLGIIPDGPLGWLDIWRQWDAEHYLQLAAHWYSRGQDWALSAFFPLLPALIRAASFFMEPYLGGMLISLVATVAAAVGLYLLGLADGLGPKRARAAVIAMLVFPTAFAFVPPYTEPLFLALVVWSFVRARQDDWVGAGLLGMLAAMARLQGILLFPALFVAYLEQHRRPGRGLLASTLVPLGTATYLLINLAAYGDPLFFTGPQREVFYHQVAPPWQVIGALVGGLQTSTPDLQTVLVYGAPLVAFGLLAAVTVWALASGHSRASYALYSLLTLASLAAMTWPISVPRYVLGVFPVYLALSGLVRWPSLAVLALISSSLLLGLFTGLFALGRWAF